MLTKIIIKNFKQFGTAEIELGNPVVFIGPNNSGKTTALQALALWEAGVRKWNEKRKDKTAPEKRPGVTINRRDLVSIPVSNSKFLWKDIHVRDVRRINGEQDTQHVNIEITVEGTTGSKKWECGLEFDFANEESFYCRPLRLDPEGGRRMPVPDRAGGIRIAFLPPMSGLASKEVKLEPGAVNVRIGEGRTADVLRNLCFNIYSDHKEKWNVLCGQIESLFGSEIEAPVYIHERGEIEMGYKEKGTSLDLSCTGRGMQQTLLLLAYMYANPGAVLLLDEPDAHLEILRQRQIYQLLTEAASENGNQILAASHSEVLLNEAAERDVVVAFVGKPHRINDRRGSHVLKALRDIGFEDYYLAEQTGWILYLEGSTDLAILRSFAEKLKHNEALNALERPFVKYIGNQPIEALNHFHGLKEGKKDLVGVGIFDNLEKGLPQDTGPEFLMWRKKEIENYLCYFEALIGYTKWEAAEMSPGPLFERDEADARETAMTEAIREIEKSLKDIRGVSPWAPDTKVSDDFLAPLFNKYYEKMGFSNTMLKKNFHVLARFVPDDKIDPEVREKLDTIARIAKSAEKP